MTVRGLIHAHSWYSFDSLLPPMAYLAYARRRRLDFLCLTDHNTIRGAVEISRANRDPGLEVVIGAEFATERGDLIGLFLREEIASRTWNGVIGEIGLQGGLVLLPHPHRHHALTPSDWASVDLVEVFNARSTEASNQASMEDALRYGIPQTVGADTHTIWELMRDGTTVSLDGSGDLRQRLLEGPRSFTTRPSSRNLNRYSRVVKSVRRRIGRPGYR
jgi:predicted metal-dependent phosphoesterase TrpH